MRLLGEKIKGGYHVHAEQQCQQPNLLDDPTPVELDYIRSILEHLGDPGRLQPNHTSCVFIMHKVSKTFEVLRLPCFPHNVWEFWAFRIMMCLRHLGWKATFVDAVGELPFDPELN